MRRRGKSEVAVDGRGAECSEERSALRIARGIGADLLFCAGVALFMTMIFGAYQDKKASPQIWLYVFAMNMIISTAIGMSLSTLYRFVQRPILDRFRGSWAYYVSHVLIVLTGVGVGVEVAIRAIAAIGGPAAINMRADVFRIGLVVATVIVVTVVSFEKLRERARATELLAQRAQREALRAQLEALQARTNPHFLFNSLNTVAGLIEEDPRGAERVLEKLSGLFRYSLDGSKTEWVRLAQEISAVNDYLDVERIRLGDRLRAEVEIESGVESLVVPPLLLQPLVENAVLHAVAPRASGGSLRVRANRDGPSLRLEVEDDGPGLGNSQHTGSGTSLEDLRQRLAMVYGGRAALETEAAAAGGCRVVVRLPLEDVAAAGAAGSEGRGVPASEEIA